MGEFFKFIVRFLKGWKRKVGMATLVMACLFTMGWVRSFFYHEGFAIPSRTQSASHSLWSNQDGLSWVKEMCLDNPDHWKDNQSFQWGSRRQSGKSVLDGFGTIRHNLLGFEVFDISYRHVNLQSGPNGDRVQMIVWIIPYWSISTPLALLAVWMLIFKPRQSSSKNIVRPKGNATN